MLAKGWSTICHAGPAIKQNRVNPANTRHWTNVVLMLSHRLRRWPNINPTLVQCLVFAETSRVFEIEGGGPRVVVSTAAFHARVRGSFLGLDGSKKQKCFSIHSYCGEPPWPSDSVLVLKPQGFEFRILCVEGSVISPYSGGSPGPISPVCAE